MFFGLIVSLKLKKWSSKPRKVRKNHLLDGFSARSGMAHSALSNDLKLKYGKNAVRVRTGDSVKLVKGEYAGIEGKVEKVFPVENRVTLEGITREKIAGGTSKVRISTSNLIITNLNLDDKWRRRVLEGAE